MSFRFCPVSKDGQLYFVDLTNPGVLQLLGERLISENQLEMHLISLQERLKKKELSDLMSSSEMIDQFGIHVFWVKRIRYGIIGLKCVCWFGRDEEERNIHHSFHFYRSMTDLIGFKKELKRFHIRD